MWTPAIERDRRIALRIGRPSSSVPTSGFEDLEERDVDQYRYTSFGDETVDGAALLEDSIDAAADQERLGTRDR